MCVCVSVSVGVRALPPLWEYFNCASHLRSVILARLDMFPHCDIALHYIRCWCVNCLVVRLPGYRSRGPSSVPEITRFP
jgi:hypothetical protein